MRITEKLERQSMPLVATLDVPGTATYLPSWHPLSGATELDEPCSDDSELVHPALCVSRLNKDGLRLFQICWLMDVTRQNLCL